MQRDPVGEWDSLFWECNLPVQMWPDGNGRFQTVVYMPRRQSATGCDVMVTPEELPQFCATAAAQLRNLADQFEALARGEISYIYYHDEDLEAKKRECKANRGE